MLLKSTSLQHILFECPLYTGVRQQHTVLFGPDQGSVCLFVEHNADQAPLVAHYTPLCFQAWMSDESHPAPQTQTVNSIDLLILQLMLPLLHCDQEVN